MVILQVSAPEGYRHERLYGQLADNTVSPAVERPRRSSWALIAERPPVNMALPGPQLRPRELLGYQGQSPWLVPLDGAGPYDTALRICRQAWPEIAHTYQVATGGVSVCRPSTLSIRRGYELRQCSMGSLKGGDDECTFDSPECGWLFGGCCDLLCSQGNCSNREPPAEEAKVVGVH
jgi:hypothetical protein